MKIIEIIKWVTGIKLWELIINAIRGRSSDSIAKVNLGDRVFMPLFLIDQDGDIASTWNYLAQSDAARKHLRAYLKANAAKGETPAITFLLTPRNCNNGLVEDDMAAVSDSGLNMLRSRCEELAADGIAIFPCLYNDDPEKDMPKWWEISQHVGIWKKVHEKIGDLVNGWLLAIENNERAASRQDIEARLSVMHGCLPGADYYGTHLQWRSDNGKYCWANSAGTPANLNLILVENSWDPHHGDAAGLDKFKTEIRAILGQAAGLKLVGHEYNLNANSNIALQQRAHLRETSIWGVG
jgi:hypothetical protein